LEITGRAFVLTQRPNLLLSQREAGTTGAVLWKITPLVASWLSSGPVVLAEAGCLHSTAVVLELGTGITGLIGLVMAPQVKEYIMTDQSYVMKTLQGNIDVNTESYAAKRRGAKAQVAKPRVMVLDWELDTPSLEGLGLDSDQTIDLIVICDTVYNEYLVDPLVTTLADICELNADQKPAVVLIAQQLRSDTVFEQFMSTLLKKFKVWRVTDEHLSIGLRSATGFAVHVAVLNRCTD
jgi:predicted nicotinamide N-methyase